MIQRRIRVAKWLSTIPALGVCTLCNQEFMVPMTALKRTADAQASLQEQFDRHKCTADVVARQEPDDEEDEEDDDHKQEKENDDDDDDDDATGGGYSESACSCFSGQRVVGRVVRAAQKRSKL